MKSHFASIDQVISNINYIIKGESFKRNLSIKKAFTPWKYNLALWNSLWWANRASCLSFWINGFKSLWIYKRFK